MPAGIGGRVRRGVNGTAVAAAVMVALTASQAPGINLVRPGSGFADPAPGADEPSPEGDSSYHTELPPLDTRDEPGADPAGAGSAESGIPATVLAAYKRVERTIGEEKPGCNLPWELLAAIGKVESGQARGGALDSDGTTAEPIRGPVLNGNGFALIKDTDGGVFDGDSVHDRAVGPMQFIPSTWAKWSADGNGDGAEDPNNIFDAALAAGRYLCANGRDLSDEADLERAVLSYNYSRDYLHTVLSWLEFYRKGIHEVPDGGGVVPDSPGAGNESEPGQKPADESESGGRSGGSSGTRPSRPGSGDSASPGPDKDSDKDSAPGRTPGPGSAPGRSPSPGQSPSPGGSPAPGPVAATLKRASAGELSATAGGGFPDRPAVRARNARGEAVADVKVEFQILGDTGARFRGGATKATAPTGSNGVATAPALSAGSEPGAFTIRATAVGCSLSPVEFAATVREKPAPQADKLSRTDDQELTATAGEAFARTLVAEATWKGTAAPGVRVVAAMVTEDGEPGEDGPYFEDADGDPVRELTALETDEDGLLELPRMYADGTTGTFQLLLTTADGGELTVTLTVVEALSPSPGPTP
jgi:hypothetical protein